MTNLPTNYKAGDPDPAGALNRTNTQVNEDTVALANVPEVAGDLGGTAVSPQVVSTHLTNPLPVNQGGTGSTTQNFVDLTAIQSIAGHKTFSTQITVPTPSASTDAATKAYVDAVAQGLSPKPSVVVATTTALPTNTYLNGTLTGASTGVLTVDGHAVAVNESILVKNESTAANNGIYVCTTAGAIGIAYVLTRSSYMNTGAQIPGAYTFVEAGTTLNGNGYVVSGAGPFTIGTTAINWTQFSGAGSISAGTGITNTSGTWSVTYGSTSGTAAQGNDGRFSQIAATTQASNYTLVLTDAGTVVESTNASAETITVPTNASVAFPIGTIIEICQVGTGQVTVAAAGGVTIHNTSSTTTRAQWCSVRLRKRGTDEWVLSGDLT